MGTWVPVPHPCGSACRASPQRALEKQLTHVTTLSGTGFSFGRDGDLMTDSPVERRAPHGPSGQKELKDGELHRR